MGDKVKLPKGERWRVGYHNKKGDLLFILTQKNEDFYLYRRQQEDDSMIKLGKAKSPTVLEEKYKVYEEMRK